MWALIALGVIALFTGPRSLLIVIPAAVFIAFEAGSFLRSDRN
jgi:hypothetical protein